MKIKLSKDDILQSKLVEPAWYRVLITEAEDKASNDGKSINCWMRGRILFNADTGDKTFEGVPAPFPWLFNSKAGWSAVGFIAAITGEEPKPDVEFNLVNAKGKQIDMFIRNEVYESVMRNVTKHEYRTPRTEPVSA